MKTWSNNTSIIEERKASLKNEKIIIGEFEAQVRDIRAQLNEQLRCIGERTEVQTEILGELEEYFKRRADLEADSARQLDKLAKNITQRHKADKTRRDGWPQHGVCSIWQQLVDDTRDEARQKLALSEYYSKVVIGSINTRSDDLTKISKKVREVCLLAHSEINRVLTELHTAMKTYQMYYTELSNMERKLSIAMNDVRRYEDANPNRNEKSRKMKNLFKHMKKREEKCDLVRNKCTKSRNEYLMCINAANAALDRFFGTDLSSVMDCVDLGLDAWLRILLEGVMDERKRGTQEEMDSLAELDTLRSSLDSKADKQRFFEANCTVFALPKKFEFRPQMGDVVSTVTATNSIAIELNQRSTQIQKRLDSLRFENEEVMKTLDASEKHLLELYKGVGDDAIKWRNDVTVTYNFYLKKFEFLLLNGNLVERLNARNESICVALSDDSNELRSEMQSSSEVARRRARKGCTQVPSTTKRPKLFGGSLVEYVEATGEAIPQLVLSAIAYLSHFSLHSQGIFRVSGSQSEINRFKEAYEAGEDVFTELTDASESNSVAGVLKMYLRGLREPLIPLYLLDQLAECAKAESDTIFIERTRELIAKLPVPHSVLLRYLFSFLSHLVEFADETMMDPTNTAICFGPTMIPIPRDQVFFHNYVNMFVRLLIINAEEVFPTAEELHGPIYDKYAVQLDNAAFIDEGECSEDEALQRQDMGAMLDSTYEDSLREFVNELAAAEADSISMTDDKTVVSQGSSSTGYVANTALTDLQHKVTAELQARFDTNGVDSERPHSSTQHIWQQERARTSDVVPAPRTVAPSDAARLGARDRLVSMPSLRDQLHLLRQQLTSEDQLQRELASKSMDGVSSDYMRQQPRGNSDVPDLVTSARNSELSSASRTIFSSNQSLLN